MSVVPGFKYDLFISYAHANDEPWSWVTHFVTTLKAELKGKSRDFTIWWDPNLRTGDHFDMAISDAISESAVFLSVLSLAYGDSVYCQKEVEEFRRLRHPAFPLVVANMSRMQGISLEREFAKDRWPPELRKTSPQPFFDESTAIFSRPQTLAHTDPWVKGMWKVRDSIWAILSHMQQLQKSGANIGRSYGVHTSGASKAPVIHVAEVTDDLNRKRSRLLSSLREGKEFEVSEWADPVAAPTFGINSLSVHMFTELSGKPLGPGKPPLAQTQLEATIASHPVRKPIVWIAPNVDFEEAETEEHKAFLQSLLNRNDLELLRTDFEDLKEELPRRMRVTGTPPEKTVRRRKEPPMLHIWHSKEDPRSLTTLEDYLNECDCATEMFEFDSEPTETLHRLLASCEGLIVPYTPERRLWAEGVVREAFRIHRRDDLPSAYAAVELPPASNEKFNFKHPRVVPIHVAQSGDFNGLSQFLSKLENPDA